MKRRIYMACIATVLLVPAATLYYATQTEGGLDLVVRALNRQLGPVRLTISGASGTLARGLHVDRLLIDHRRVHIEIDDARGRIAVLPLLWQSIHVRDLAVGNLLIHVLPRTTPDTGWKPHFLPPFLRISADRVRVRQGRLIVPSGHQFDASDMRVAAVLHPRTIRAFDARMRYNGVLVQAAGIVRASEPLGLAFDLRLATPQPSKPGWVAHADIDGNLARLAIQGEITAPLTATFLGDADDLTGDWHWQGRSELNRLDLAAWNLGHALGNITGTLQLAGNHSGFHAVGPVRAAGLPFGALDLDFGGSYADRTLDVARLTLRHRAAGATLRAVGTIRASATGAQLDLRGDWTHFRWPLTGADSAAPVHSSHGTYHLDGHAPYQLTAAGTLDLRSAPSLSVDLTGHLGKHDLTIQHADISAAIGRATLNGVARWLPRREWQAQGHIDTLKLSQWHSGLAGDIGAAVVASGAGYGTGVTDLHFSDLAGTVRGQPASGQAHVIHAADGWSFDAVKLDLGTTHIEADGHVGVSTDLDFALRTQDLALFAAGARGTVTARGTLQGDLHDPTVIGTLKGRNIQWGRLRLAGIDATVDLDANRSKHANIQLGLDKLQFGARVLDHVTLHTDGTTARHRWALAARTATLTTTLGGTGAFRDGIWALNVDRFDVDDQQNLKLRLESPASLVLDAESVTLDQLCVHDEHARLCTEAMIDDAQRHLTLSATHMPMRALTAGLASTTDFDGTLSVQAQLDSANALPWQGSLKAQLTDAAARRHFENGRSETLKLGSGQVDMQLARNQLTGTLSLDAGAAGRVSGSINAQGLDTDWHDWPLHGEIALNTDSLGFLDSYVTQIDRATGRLDASLTVTGTVGAPQLAGLLQLQQAQLDMYQINLALRAVNFGARLHGNMLDLSGSADAGAEGHGQINGQLSWHDGLIHGDLALKGHDLRVVNIPEARIDASPDVNVHLDGHQINVSGQVTLPYARIERAALANAVLASSDEVIVGANQPSTPPTPFKVASDITLKLGDRVTVDTLGLRGRLGGSLRVTTNDSGISRGTGELTIEEGKYTAYGRRLDIERGRLLFGNGLLGDPVLDLRATKQFPDIIAGVNVRGTLQQPRMTFFSEPQVSQSQIVSLLLAGGSLESVQNTPDPGEHASSAGSALLMQGGAILGQQIGSKIGIEDVGVESDLANETSLVLGRYLSPRLYVSYGIGLAEAINTIKLRYTIGDHWTIKTEAGTQRSADLVYTVER